MAGVRPRHQRLLRYLTAHVEIGLYTFGDVGPGEAPKQRLREIVEQMVLADEVGLDVFGVGEHHSGDYAASAPAVILAAGAARTSRIRLTSAVTVLATDDPVRVFQQFATLDLLSGGRAEIMVGRGAFAEPFRLFGYDLADYDALFAEKLDLLLQVRGHERVLWSGQFRAPLPGQSVHPRPIQDPLPVWAAAGGNRNSVVRAGTLGLPLALAISGSRPRELYAPLVALHRWAAARAGRECPRVSLNAPGFVARDRSDAVDIYYPHYAAVTDRLGRKHGRAPVDRRMFTEAAGPRGTLMVGSPDEVVEKILFHHEVFRHDRTLIQLALGGVPHRAVLTAIELLGTEVAPRVRAEMARHGRLTAP